MQVGEPDKVEKQKVFYAMNLVERMWNEPFNFGGTVKFNYGGTRTFSYTYAFTIVHLRF